MKKLVAYITTGFPDKNFTVDLALSLKEAGVDSLELGIPFSDPVADGPVIEAANLLALQNGFKIADLLEVSEKIAPEIDTLWMGYFNPFYHKGLDFFLTKAKEYGVSSFIIPDLPHEEGIAYRQMFDEKDIALIDFVAPTDSKERIADIVKDAKKFIYMVAYAGITGAEKSESLDSIISAVRENTDTPLYIGFGVNEKTAKEKAKGVDGVIVGSAFVKILLQEDLTNSQKIDNISTLARSIKELINE
ncbi:tryptophan synthase subunit alpha [Hydrogenimonas thermophila]|uniref:Tryptophan synthase alpha chain n=1 Tax=Hydrogenimonas thermophila TaxID=223786 RepID=A0A1I5SE09_9BACT|nr:tryptophan synthase subunit alpha [Hydrogenimonas thermophila]SFP68974.1 tryptophan synthase, alpha chain [Hydrogenimonas thermophila]